MVFVFFTDFLGTRRFWCWSGPKFITQVLEIWREFCVSDYTVVTLQWFRGWVSPSLISWFCIEMIKPMMHWYCEITVFLFLFVHQINWTTSDRPSTESPWNCWGCRNSVRVGDRLFTASTHLYPCVCVTCISALLCIVCMFLVDVVFLGHITTAFVQEGGANLMFDREEVTQTLSTMFHNVSREVPGQLTAVEQMCTLVFQLFDRCGHNKSRVLI